MTRTTILVALTLISTAACAAASSSGLTPLELESVQTREFETTKGAALEAVVTVFQDLGYAIESVDKDTGAITAGGPRTDTGSFWTDMTERPEFEQSKATALVEERGEGRTRVRLNLFVSTQKSSKTGRTSVSDQTILDGTTYKSIFSRIEQALFVRSARD